jgi:hypothetical protein
MERTMKLSEAGGILSAHELHSFLEDVMQRLTSEPKSAQKLGQKVAQTINEFIAESPDSDFSDEEDEYGEAAMIFRRSLKKHLR